MKKKTHRLTTEKNPSPVHPVPAPKAGVALWAKKTGLRAPQNKKLKKIKGPDDSRLTFCRSRLPNAKNDPDDIKI